jgi:hypothetical protein
MRTRAATVSLFVIAGLALGACGSDTKTISKADYVRKGNQVCVDGSVQVRNVERKAPNVDLNGDLTKAQLKAVGDVLVKAVKIQNDLIKKLRGLGSPKGDSATLEKIYDTSDTGASQVDKAADAAHANKLPTFRTEYAKGLDTLAQAQRKIVSYGLTKCGNS